MKKWLFIPFLVMLLIFTGTDFQKAEAASVSQLNTVSKKYLGVRYTYGGTSVSTGFDCSGYTQTVFRDLGISLPRTTGLQMAKGTAVKKSDLKPGDLIFFNTSGKGVSHVGIYIGDNNFIHSATGGVQITSLSNSYWKARYMTAKRIASLDSAQVAKAATPKKETTKTVNVTGNFKTTANLNLRSTASTNGKVLVTIPKGKQVSAISKTGNWYKVKYGNKTGFVSASYLTKVTSKPATTAKAKTTTTKKATPKNESKATTTANVNLRASNSTKGKVLVTIPKGKQVTIHSKSGNWYKVTYGKKTGFVSASYVKATSNTTKTVATSKTTNLKTTANLNLRSAKTTSSKVLKLIPKGKQVKLVSKSGNWYKVTYGGKTGFVSASYVK